MYSEKQLKEKSINLNQYPIIENIDKMIALELEKIELYKKMKQAIFLHKLTEEKIIYQLKIKDSILYFNEVDGKKLLDGRGYDIQKIDVAKLRLKNITE